LHIACASGNLELVQLLVAKGSSINSCSSVNFTPLHSAASKSKELIIAFLVSKDIDSTIRDFNGQTALELALDNHPSLATYFNKEEVLKKFNFNPVVAENDTTKEEIEELKKLLDNQANTIAEKKIILLLN